MPKISPSLQHDVERDESVSLAFGYLLACEAGDDELRRTYEGTFVRGALIPGFLLATGALITANAEQFLGGVANLHIIEEMDNHRDQVKEELAGKGLLVRIRAARWESWVLSMALCGSVQIPNPLHSLKRGELEGLGVHLYAAAKRNATSYPDHTRIDVLRALQRRAYEKTYGND